MAPRKASLLARAGKAVKRLFSAVFGSKEDADRRHEREMAELEALQKGKVTPAYLARYAAVVLISLLCVLIVVDVTFPDLFPGSPLDAVEHVMGSAVDALKAVFGM